MGEHGLISISNWPVQFSLLFEYFSGLFSVVCIKIQNHSLVNTQLC